MMKTTALIAIRIIFEKNQIVFCAVKKMVIFILNMMDVRSVLFNKRIQTEI